MADVTKGTYVAGANTQLTRSSVRVITERYEMIPGKVSGEDLDAGDLVFLWTDEKWYKGNADDAMDNAAAVGSDQDDAKLIRGMVMQRAKAGYGCDVCYEGRFGGYSGLTPGANLYLSDTPGALSDTPGTVPIIVAFAVDARTIQLCGSNGYFPPTVTDT